MDKSTRISQERITSPDIQLHDRRQVGSVRKETNRVYLIGNGSSLTKTPLEKCRPAIGVNKIGAIFTPDYYVKVDYTEFDDGDWKSEVMPMVEKDIPCLLWDWFDVDAPNVRKIPRCEHHGVPDGHKSSTKGWHQPFCTAYNSISIMAQWAVQLGFNEIVLVGCDLNFTNGVDDHFMPYYTKVDGGYVERNNRFALAAHKLIKECCPVPVYNATIGGELEIYPRLDLFNG